MSRLVIRLSDPTDPPFAGIGAALDTVDDLTSLASVVAGRLSPEVQSLLRVLRDPHNLRARRFVSRSVIAPADLRGMEAGAGIGPSRPTRPSLTGYWIVETDALSEAQLRAFHRSLWDLPVIERALREPDLGEPAVAHLDEYYDDQGYLQPAPRGIDVERAWEAGFSGGVTRIADVERGWLFDHEDLPSLAGNQPLHLNNSTKDRMQDHGTNVLGVLAAMDGPTQTDGSKPPGIVGIVPHLGAAGLLTLSRYESFGDDRDVAGAVFTAMGAMEEGDVLLLEVELNITIDYEAHNLPLEVFEPFWNLIRTAVDSGITVIEPAGNSDRDLDGASSDQELRDYFEGDSKWKRAANTADYGSGLMQLDRTQTGEFMDSGAIMVGGCVPDSYVGGAGNIGTKSTNYGNRVDCYAWGEGVFTTANKHFEDTPNGPNTPAAQSYTNNFDGTSAASAIVAGAAVLVQDMYKKYVDDYADPSALRDLLTDSEASTAHAGAKAIGVMPDLGDILRRLECENPTGWRRLKCWVRRKLSWLAKLLGW